MIVMFKTRIFFVVALLVCPTAYGMKEELDLPDILEDLKQKLTTLHNQLNELSQNLKNLQTQLQPTQEGAIPEELIKKFIDLLGLQPQIKSQEELNKLYQDRANELNTNFKNTYKIPIDDFFLLFTYIHKLPEHFNITIYTTMIDIVFNQVKKLNHILRALQYIQFAFLNASDSSFFKISSLESSIKRDIQQQFHEIFQKNIGRIKNLVRDKLISESRKQRIYNILDIMQDLVDKGLSKKETLSIIAQYRQDFDNLQQQLIQQQIETDFDGALTRLFDRLKQLLPVKITPLLQQHLKYEKTANDIISIANIMKELLNEKIFKDEVGNIKNLEVLQNNPNELIVCINQITSGLNRGLRNVTGPRGELAKNKEWTSEQSENFKKMGHETRNAFLKTLKIGDAKEKALYVKFQCETLQEQLKNAIPTNESSTQALTEIIKIINNLDIDDNIKQKLNNLMEQETSLNSIYELDQSIKQILNILEQKQISTVQMLDETTLQKSLENLVPLFNHAFFYIGSLKDQHQQEYMNSSIEKLQQFVFDIYFDHVDQEHNLPYKIYFFTPLCQTIFTILINFPLERKDFVMNCCQKIIHICSSLGLMTNEEPQEIPALFQASFGMREVIRWVKTTDEQITLSKILKKFDVVTIDQQCINLENEDKKFIQAIKIPIRGLLQEFHTTLEQSYSKKNIFIYIKSPRYMEFKKHFESLSIKLNISLEITVPTQETDPEEFQAWLKTMDAIDSIFQEKDIVLDFLSDEQKNLWAKITEERDTFPIFFIYDLLSLNITQDIQNLNQQVIVFRNRIIQDLQVGTQPPHSPNQVTVMLKNILTKLQTVIQERS